MEKELLLQVKGMNKSFGPTRALKNVDLSVYRGEVRGLIGENGSGKSTVSSIVAGIQNADSGEMIFKGQPYQPATMLDAMQHGIGMIVQEAGTVLNITVAENIFIGKEKRFSKGPFVNRKAMEMAAKQAMEALGVSGIDPAMPINKLNFEARKLIEIVRVMLDEPELLIVDETTTALSQHGWDIIYSLMKKLREEGKAVLFISHDLDELIETCDVLTVLRDGDIIRSLEKSEMEHDLIKELMVGRKIEGDYYRSDFDGSFGEEVAVRVENLTVGHELENFSLELHRGEILGVGGLSGSGMHELGRAMFGVDRALTGSVTVCRSGDVIKNPVMAVQNSMGYVSKNRDTEALILHASIKDNTLLPSYDRLKVAGLISKRKADKFADEQIQNMKVKCVSKNQEVQFLSGGNKQKVVFAKWIGTGADILILDSPTRGIDIGVKTAMYQLITRLKREGKAILMISEELPELIGMCDRIMILKDGHLAREFQRSSELSEQMIIKEMI